MNGGSVGSTDRPRGSVDRGPGSVSRPRGSVDRGPGSVSRPRGSVDRGHGSVSHRQGSVDRGHGSVSRRQGSAYSLVDEYSWNDADDDSFEESWSAGADGRDESQERRRQISHFVDDIISKKAGELVEAEVEVVEVMEVEGASIGTASSRRIVREISVPNMSKINSEDEDQTNEKNNNTSDDDNNDLGSNENNGNTSDDDNNIFDNNDNFNKLIGDEEEELGQKHGDILDKDILDKGQGNQNANYDNIQSEKRQSKKRQSMKRQSEKRQSEKRQSEKRQSEKRQSEKRQSEKSLIPVIEAKEDGNDESPKSWKSVPEQDQAKGKARRYDVIETTYVTVPESGFPNEDKCWSCLYLSLAMILWFMGVLHVLIALAMALVLIGSPDYAKMLIIPAILHMVLGFLVRKAAEPTQPQKYVSYKNLSPSLERVIDSIAHSVLVLDTVFLVLLSTHMSFRVNFIDIATPVDPVQMLNAFTFNIPTLIYSICSERSRDFFAVTPDPHARAFYGIFCLLMVGIGISFLTVEVLWRKSYAGKKIFRLTQSDLDEKELEKQLLQSLDQMRGHWNPTGVDWQESPFYKIQRAVLLEKPDDLEIALAELDEKKIIMNLTREEEAEVQEYKDLVKVLQMAKELSIRENVEEAMRDRDLVHLEAALIEYRGMLKKNGAHSQFADQNLLKEARALGLQLRSEEQVHILANLKQAIENNDYAAAEANVEVLQANRLLDDNLKRKATQVLTLFYETEKKRETEIRKEISEGAWRSDVDQLRRGLKRFDRCGLKDDSKTFQDYRKTLVGLEAADQKRLKREMRKALVDEPEDPNLRLRGLLEEYKKKEYPMEEGDVVSEAQAALDAWKVKRETEVEDFVAQLKMTLLMAPDSLTWRELEADIEKFKAMGLEDKEGLLTEAQLVLEDMKQTLTARNKVLVDNLISAMQRTLTMPIGMAMNELAEAIAPCLDAHMTEKDGPIEEAFLLQSKLELEMTRRLHEARDNLGLASTVLQLRSALLFVEANKLPETAIAHPPLMEGVTASKEWPPTILFDAKASLPEKMADAVALLSASQKVGSIPNYRDMAQINDGMEKYRQTCLFPGEEEEDVNFQDALQIQREYREKLFKREEGIKKDMSKAIEEARQMEMAFAIRDWEDCGITDNQELLQTAKDALRSESSTKELKVRLREATQDENLREIREILLLLESMGLTPATDRKCAKAERRLKQLDQDFEKKKKFLAELTEKNDVHQKSIMEMLVRDLADLGFDQRNDPEIAEAVLQLERLRVAEAANKALAEGLISGMSSGDIEALRLAIQDFQTAGLTNADGPLDEARDALARLRDRKEREKKDKCAALERAIQRNSVVALELAIADFNGAGLKNTDGPVLEAAMVLEMVQDTKRKRHRGYDTKLQDAMANERLALVESLVHEIQSEHLTSMDVPSLTAGLEWIADRRAAIGREEKKRKAQDQDWSKSEAHLKEETLQMEKCEEACKFSTEDAALKDKLERHRIRCKVLESRAQLHGGQSAAKNITILQQKADSGGFTVEEKRWLKELVVAEDTVELRKQLRDATAEKDAHFLEIVVKRIQKAGLQNRMAKELTEAEENIKIFNRVEAIRKQVREMKPALIAEIISYRDPPTPVFSTMKAVFHLLGHDLADLSWDNCVKLLKKTGKDGIKTRIQSFDPAGKGVADKKQRDACRDLMKGLDTMELSHTSMCAAVFGLWVTTMIETIDNAQN